jgi:Flp pilus assembly protein TadG
MLRPFRKLRRADSGMAIVEFALVLPAMLALAFGGIEVTNALICKSDVSNIASSAADLVTQESQVSTADMNNVFSALGSLIYPFPATSAKIVITSVIDDGHGGGKVDWSQSYNATKRSKGSAVTIPTGLMTTGGSVVLSEVTYTYTPLKSLFVKLPITMTNTFYSHPRRVAQIKCTDCGS